jgi:RsiW-degrading membrane proteinase PrsW (M82 family)
MSVAMIISPSCIIPLAARTVSVSADGKPQEIAATILGWLVILALAGFVVFFVLGMILLFLGCVTEGAQESGPVTVLVMFLVLTALIGLVAVAFGASLVLSLAVALGGGVISTMVILANH